MYYPNVKYLLFKDIFELVIKLFGCEWGVEVQPVGVCGLLCWGYLCC